MPLFAYVPPPHDAKTLHHHRRVQAAVKKKVPTTDARTLLPMNGGSTTGTVTTPGTTTTVAVQSPPPPPLNQNQNPVQIGPPKILIPDDAPTSNGRTAGVAQPQGGSSPHGLRTITQLYFDAGAEDLIGTFTTLVQRAGLRYNNDEVDVYFRNETLDTVGTNLPFQQVISGASVGAAYRHFFLHDHVFVTISDGEYLSGPFKNHADFRVGAVGEWGWSSDKAFTDIYSDLFYVDLLSDTIFTARVRSGPVLLTNKTGRVIGYGVGQLIVDSLGTEGSENRVEGGFGVGYIFMGHISLNVDMRAGYGFRGEIFNRAYLNPMIVLSGSF